MTATGYFKVATSFVPNVADTVFPFDGRDLDSVSLAWSKARELREAHGARCVARWGSIQVQGPWSTCLRVDK
jgi:hypothetical protein